MTCCGRLTGQCLVSEPRRGPEWEEKLSQSNDIDPTFAFMEVDHSKKVTLTPFLFSHFYFDTCFDPQAWISCNLGRDKVPDGGDIPLQITWIGIHRNVPGIGQEAAWFFQPRFDFIHVARSRSKSRRHDPFHRLLVPLQRLSQSSKAGD